jgi:transposase
MAWTAQHRRAADRRGLRYPSDLTDAEWALVLPLIRPAKHGGRPRTVDVREVLNAVFYVLSTGCQWQALPKDLPPKSTAWSYFSRWEWEGTIEAHPPCPLCRGARAGRSRGQSDDGNHRQPDGEGRAKGGSTLDPSGYDAGKKVVGRERPILTDTMGLLLGVVVHPASVQDRDGAEPLLRQARRLFPFVERIMGDAGYQGPKMAAAAARTGLWKVEIVRRCDRHRFVVLPKRWIVERTLGWISHHRRLARDLERHARIAAAFVRMAMIRIMLRRLAPRHSM